MSDPTTIDVHAVLKSVLDMIDVCRRPDQNGSGTVAIQIVGGVVHSVVAIPYDTRPTVEVYCNGEPAPL